jgi:hypothetical protein
MRAISSVEHRDAASARKLPSSHGRPPDGRTFASIAADVRPTTFGASTRMPSGRW